MVFTGQINTVPTKPIEGQQTGTSGLRKRTAVATSENFLENWVQSLFSALGESMKGKTLALGGDGRYFNDVATQKIIKLAAANGVARMVVAKDGILSTPALSVIVRERKLFGGIIMTASHNPAGPDRDWGIKYNCENGGPAPESVTDAVYQNTRTISEFKIAQFDDVNISQLGVQAFDGFEVEVVDSCAEYVVKMKEVFDFPAIKALFEKGFRFNYDAMHAVTGPYARVIFGNELGCSPDCLFNCDPKPDFGGGHPDPNLTYAADLVAKMKAPGLHLGAASDGDGDRNMILGGNGFFVSPSDSVAMIAANAQACIPYFKGGLKGLARSMPTSSALDRVAKKLGCEIFETPTGWKYFGNLMDAGRTSICGEESFGTGSDHIREKDGIWAMLAWMQIFAKENEGKHAGDQLVTLEEIAHKHWSEYGRIFFVRFDYEECDKAAALKMFEHLDGFIANPALSNAPGKITTVDQFEYHDPIDKSVATRQGFRFLFENGDRIVFRLSSTGTSGATIRLYVEHSEADSSQWSRSSVDACRPLLDAALSWSRLQEFTGRTEPTVIT